MRTQLLLPLLGALLVAGCSGTPSDQDSDSAPVQVGIAWHQCPDITAIALPTEHRCGTLTVPLDHDDPGRGLLALELLEVSPSGSGSPAGVALSVGFNFGEPRQPPGDMHALAERISVPVVALAPRGVGADGGIPLDCPEADGIGSEVIDQPDAVSGEALLVAVTACHDRLQDDGADLEVFGVDDIARDVEALREALGIEQWYALISYGTLSRVSDAYASSHADRIRAIVQDSPAPSGSDSFSSAGPGLRSTMAALFEECADDPPCTRRYPGLESSWSRAIQRLTARPLSATTSAGSVLVDAPKFLRSVRSTVGNGPKYLGDLPRTITMAAEGQLHPTLAAVVAGDPGHCLGHRPICTLPGFSLGAYLSQACPELGIGDAATEDDALYREVFVDNAYADACEVWGVDPADPAPAPEPPTLVITGHLDSWSRPEWFDGALVVRGASHDVAASSTCVFEVRNPWIADPTTKPDPTPCDAEPFPAWD